MANKRKDWPRLLKGLLSYSNSLRYIGKEPTKEEVLERLFPENSLAKPTKK